MKRYFLPLLLIGLVTALLTGCYRPATADITPTPSQEDVQLTQMAELGIEAVETSATLTAQALPLTAMPTPTPTMPPLPTAEPTEEPTAVVTAEPVTAEPTAVPTAAPTQQATVAPTAAATTAPSGAETTYTVRAGDNLFRIALRYGLTVERLASYNGITNASMIYVGQAIRVPGSSSAVPTPQPGQGEQTHVVQVGENLFRIALRYNMSHLYLASYNGISNPNQIYPGQVIRIPATP